MFGADDLGAAGLAGGLGLVGGIMQNQAAAKEAQRNRDFQERLSSTAHQREVADLKAAGLNPLLSATGGSGASTPTGAMAPVENAVQSAVTSAKDAQGMVLSRNMQKQELANMVKQGNLLDAQAQKTAVESHVISKGIPEADTKNFLFKGIKNFLNTSAKDARPLEIQNREAVERFNKLTGKKLRLRRP